MGRSKDIATSAKGDADYVNVSGDTMTGDLTISSTAGQLKLTDTDGTEQNTTIKQSGGNLFIQARDNTNNSGIVFAGNGGGNYSEHMRINGSGIVTMPKQPVFMVIMTSAPTLTGTSTTTLPWNSEILDIGSNFNTSNYRFTAPANGLYYMHLHLEFHSDSSWTSSTWSYIGDYYVNGTQKTGADFWGHSSKYNLASNAAILELNANDYVDVRARPNNNTLRYSGDSAGAFGNSRWFGYLIG